MKPILLLLVICGAWWPALGAGASGNSRPMPTPDGERFLFVVDISAKMERLQEANEAALYELIGSGVNRQMRPGDTYGIWTFNRTTSAGKFPMQIWDSRNASQLGTIAAAYLAQQTYEHSSDLTRLVPALNALIHSVSNLNVFIISNGDSPLVGTPLDKALNAEYKAKRKQRIKAEKPFITTLMARDGWVINGVVTIAGEPIELLQRRLPVVVEKKPLAPPKPPAKIEPVAPAPISASAAPAAAEMAKPTTSAAGVAVAEIKSKPEAADASAARPRVMQIITKAKPVLTNDEPAMTAAPVSLEPVQTSLSSSEVSPPGLAAIPSNAPVAPILAEPEPVVRTVTAQSILEAIRPSAMPVVARELNAEPEPPTAEPPSTVQAVGLPAAHQEWRSSLMLTYGIILMAAALFLLVVVFRINRPGPVAQGSLITQSMDRQ
jgi:hypothetical protein